MRTRGLLFLFLALGILLFSGCLREYTSVEITNIDVMVSQQDEGTKLTVTPYIQNNQNRDTGALTVKVKVKDPST
ncbi:MAG TPA: hypothetical protein VIO11_08635, partial [Candidatus Methanoperedens sp.]